MARRRRLEWVRLQVLRISTAQPTPTAPRNSAQNGVNAGPDGKPGFWARLRRRRVLLVRSFLVQLLSVGLCLVLESLVKRLARASPGRRVR